MQDQVKINVSKQDDCEQNANQNRDYDDRLQRRHEEIKIICQQLSGASKLFDEEATYEVVCTYIEKYERWFYADISNYLFECNEQNMSTFLTNLETLQSYAYRRFEELSEKGDQQDTANKMVVSIDKFSDHANLAQKQYIYFKNSEETFDNRFDKRLVPFKAEFAHEMNMQFVSLIAIFTALSFIIFGGISSLDNIFLNATNVPILELIIIGSIWSICISNLVFVFMIFVSKLTKVQIKASTREHASISEKYPVMVWCNYLLFLIFALSCWFYYIDYSNSGGWLLSFSRNHEAISLLGGFALIGVLFLGIAIFLLRHKKEE